jgi:hypothetical protein
MSDNPIRGKTFRFTFHDGAMAGKTFEHAFGADSTVVFHMMGGEQKAGEKLDRAPPTKYELATIRDDVCAVSYLSSAGYTLTTVLDFATKRLVAFSSNEKMLGVQRGSFEELNGAATRASSPHDRAHAPAPRH